MLVILGSLALAVASLLGIALVFMGLSDEGSRDGGRAMAVMMLTLPYLGALLVAYGCGIAREGFDWVLPGAGGGMRWTLVLLSVIAAGVLALGCAALKPEPASQVPWVLLFLRGWGAVVWPPLLAAFAALALFPGLKAGWPAWAWQMPQQAVAGVSLVVAVGLVVSGVLAMAHSQAVRVQAEVDFNDRRDDTMLKKVQDADPRNDFLSLLPHSSVHEQPHIRELALSKLRSRPDLNEALATVLRTEHAQEVFRFLASNDPPDAPALAEAVRDGIEQHMRRLGRSIAGTHTLRPDDYQYPVLDILATADRFAAQGVDYKPALRQLRKAFDTEREYAQPTPTMNGQKAIDDWLKKH